MSAWNAAMALLRRELLLALRQGSDVALALGFFVLVVVLFPLALGPETALLARLAPGLLWIAAALAMLLSLGRLFEPDALDGSLDALLLSPLPLPLAVPVKLLAHWLLTGLPLLLLAAPLGAMLGLPAPALPVLLGALALGTPSFTLVGAIGAALALGARHPGALVALLVLPLTVPVLIFGAAATAAAAAGLPAGPPLLWLAALAAALLGIAPVATAAALRQAAA